MTDKRELRSRLLARRAELSADAVADAGRALAERAAAVGRERGARRLAAYLSVGPEPPTWPLLDALLAAGVEVVVPRSLPERRIVWVPYAGPDALVVGRFGIPEPGGDGDAAGLAGVDLVLVPALAVDLAGHRLGRGGGYYDTALEAYPSPLRVALTYDHEVVPDVFPEPHDQRVDVVVTPVRTLALPPQ